MSHILSYKEGKDLKTIKLNELQANAVRDRILKSSDDKSAMMTVGEDTIRLANVISISTEKVNVNRQTKKDLRKQLIGAAASCKGCSGSGFVDVFSSNGRIIPKWEAGCLVEVQQCSCQKGVKFRAGVDPDDMSYLYAEFDLAAA